MFAILIYLPGNNISPESKGNIIIIKIIIIIIIIRMIIVTIIMVIVVSDTDFSWSVEIKVINVIEPMI